MVRSGARLVAMLAAAAASLAAAPATLAAPPVAAAPVAAAPVVRATDPPHRYEWWYDKMHLAQAHRISTGKGVTVAVIDSSLDARIPELRDADITFGHTCKAGYEKKATSLTGLVADHGTAMTTLIAGGGRGFDGPGILGVAPDAHILFYPDDEDGKYTDFIDCDNLELGKQVVDAARRGADIINLSFSGGPGLVPYVRKAMALGAVVVAAAGDRRDSGAGWIEYPAAMPGVVAVQAADVDAQPWVHNPVPVMIDGTFHAAAPTITAPGVDVQNTAFYASLGRWGDDGVRTGTSDATAIVSGVLALVKSRYPHATANQLIQQLIHHSGGPRRYEWDPDFGYGIVSAPKMLASSPTGWPDVNPLLKGPHAAIRNYPPSSYDASRPVVTQTRATSRPSATPAPSTGATATPSSSPSAATGAASSGGSNGAGSSGGLPAWSWLVGVGVLLAGAAAFVGRRASRRTA